MSATVLSNMLEILAVCIDESDVITPNILESILTPLTSPQKKDFPPQYALSQRLILRCSTRLQVLTA